MTMQVTRPAFASLGTYADQLASSLRPRWGDRADALALAYDQFLSHKSRDRFNAEVAAIKSCRIVEQMEVRDV